ncbi:MAG TPA: CoA ester lyase [Permianibacter sp.]|nr:CoA ester lyase [Permianibacter sp.]
MNNVPYRPRRTMLYVPAHVERHLEKARGLQADSVIFDLQESVPSSLKTQAREQLRKAFENPNFGHSEKVVRINPLYSPWGQEDLRLAASLPIDAILLPRVESKQQVLDTLIALDALEAKHIQLMCNIESPFGVLRAEEIAGASDRVCALVMGTTDLANELKLNPTPERTGLQTSLGLVILAARAHRKCVVDGPHFDLRDIKAAEFACRQARDLGFDGKAIIHPIQLTYANDAFTPKRGDVDRAQRIITALNEADANGMSTAVIDDRLIEPAMIEWARRVIAVFEAVHALGQTELLGQAKRR